MNPHKFPSFTGLFTLLCLALCLASLQAIKAATLTPTGVVQSWQAGTLNSTLLWSNTTYTVNSSAVELQPRKGIRVTAVMTPGVATNVATLVYQTADVNTNWSTHSGLTQTVTLTNAGTQAIASTNFPPDLVGNAKFFRLATVATTQTNQITNSITYEIDMR